MTGIWNYLKEGTLPEDKDEARKMRVRSAKFVIVRDELFKRGISAPLLKCLAEPQTMYVIEEIHRGICGMHSGARSMATRSFEDFLHELGIKHLPTSVEHPQTNGQAKAANKVILRELKKRMGNAKGQWVEELPSILWAYHCTPQSTTQETPYRLTYGADTMIPVEFGETSHRCQVFDSEQNVQETAIDLDLIDELREEARIHEEACKLRASRSYNTRICPRSF
ncbi:uncharacterized protein LOC109811036 [Cajanus cajan]|uniref:uncharacterized protein LOC109811036 n=1 Tax=Cajanus cajan TaxID=3821 RepID=UPI00098DBF81|nr:uncharacterized protein LOC109811036 [Cajanus cajan]